MITRYISRLGLAACLGFSALASAQEPLDDRFYIAPLFSYGFNHEDNAAPDDQLGGQLSFGKTLTRHLAVELYGYHFNDIETRNFGPRSDVDATGYGVSALLFPFREIVPVFAILGVGVGQYDYDNRTAGPVGLDDQDSDFYDVGIGALAPIPNLDIFLRGEWRYRATDIDAPGGGEYKDRDNVVSLGIQVPLGAKPVAAPPPARPAPRPRPKPAQRPVDSDRDGVPDNRDQCPGTVRGTPVGANGCPIKKSAPIVLKGVTFEFDSARLTSRARDRLDNVVNSLRSSKNVNVSVEGHTDSIGSNAYNQRLSSDRANSVKRYLVDHGISSRRLKTRGFGESRPVAPNNDSDGSDNPEGRAQNRRVELHIDGNKK